jgi:ferredoxin
MSRLLFIIIFAACFYSVDVFAFLQIKSGRVRDLEPRLLMMAKNRFSPPSEEDPNKNTLSPQQSDNGYAFEIELPKRAGIDWGADLSFSWVYVLGLDPQGEAFKSNMIEKGDFIIGVGNTSTIARDFDFVLNALNKYPEQRLTYTFFRGTKRQVSQIFLIPDLQYITQCITFLPISVFLYSQLVGDDSSLILNPTDVDVTVTVQQQGKPDVVLNCPGGTNLRRLLISNGINVYRSLTRWTNCNGGQRCGTCIVDVEKGIENCSRKDLNEQTVLAENDPTCRLACITSVYGDVTVTVQGPVGAAQWTR